MSIEEETALKKLKFLLRKKYSGKSDGISFVVESGSNYDADTISNFNIDKHLNEANTILIIIEEKAAVTELGKLNFEATKNQKIYVSLNTSIHTDIKALTKALEWIKEREKLIALLHFSQNYKNKFTKNRTKISGMLNVLTEKQLCCPIKYTSQFHTKGKEPTALEEDVLNCALAVCETQRVVALSLQVPFMKREIVQWNKLQFLLSQAKNTIEGEIHVQFGIVEDITWLEPLMNCFLGKSQLILPKQQTFNFSSNLVEAINVVVMKRYQHEPKIKFHGIPTYCVYLPLEKVEAMFESIERANVKKITNLKFLAEEFELKQTTTKNLELSVGEAYSLLPSVREVLESKLINVFNVTFDAGKEFDLKKTEEGREFLNFMRGREIKRLEYFISTSKMGLYNRAKMMVVGAGEAGKTSLCRRLLGKGFDPNHISTVVGDCQLDATDVHVNKWKQLGTGDNLLTTDFFEMTENINNDVRDGIASIPMGGSIKKYTANPRTTQWILERKPELKDPSRRLPSPQIIEDSEKSLKSMKGRRGSFMNWIGTQFFGRRKEKVKNATLKPAGIMTQTTLHLIPNVVSNKKLSIWDFGGQKVFDVLHHLYLTNAGLVLLVVNLVHFFDKPSKARDELCMWLRSLCVYTKDVKLFIVGTRCHNMKDDKLLEVSNMIGKELSVYDTLGIVEYERQNPQEASKSQRPKDKFRLKFFPVDNRTGSGIIEVQTAIALSLQPEENSNFNLPANEKIPLAWMFFMHLVHRDDGNITSLNELFKRGEAMGFDLEEMRRLVNFFTKAGIIVSFHERFENDLFQKNNDIVDDVVLKPNWLLQTLGTFISDDQYHANEFENIERERNMGSLIQLYKKRGILSNYMLEQVLTKKGLNKREIIFIKNVCQRMLIFSKLTSFPEVVPISARHLEAANGFWVVPSMNNMANDVNEEPFPKKNVTRGKIEWDDVVPQGLFERCVCSILDQDLESMSLVSLTTSRARFKYKNTLAELVLVNDTKYSVGVSSTNRYILQGFKKILANMQEEINGLGFALELRANIKFAENLKVVTVTQENNFLYRSFSQRDTGLKWDCFLSHTWGQNKETHERVVKIGRLLEEQGINIWLDEDQMQDDILSQMLEGMNKSGTFIAFITKKYLEASDDPNSNAGRECRYASKLGAQYMIPVLLDSDYANPNSWQCSAGLLMPTTLYIDFTTEENIERNLPQLCTRIRKVVRERQKLD